MVRLLGGQPVRHERRLSSGAASGFGDARPRLLLYCRLLFAVALGAGVLIGWAIWGH